MKSLTYFNPNRVDEYDNVFDALDSLANRATLATDILDALRIRGEMSGSELDKEVTKRWGEEKYSIRPLLDNMASWKRYVRTEVREEESIKVEMKYAMWGRVIKTHDDSFVIFAPWGGPNDTPFLVYNPVIKATNSMGLSCVEGERMVQVRRKYYVWVG